jgi:nucleotide-binding universal stress UspA family protein
MKRILVPVDFSEEAKCAAMAAASIARKTNAKIFLLHMIEIPEGVIDMQGGTDNSSPAAIFLMKKIHERFDELKSESFFNGLEVEETVNFEKTFNGVLDGSKKYNVDLIVMGSSGATGIKEIVVGSNTEKIVRHSDVPVLVIKKGSENLEINDVVFASEFKDEGKERFRDVFEFTSIFNAKLHLLYINTASNFKTTKAIDTNIAAFLADVNLADFDVTIYNDISVEKGILNFAKEINADLIALNTHGRSGLSQLFNGSIGQELANHALKPVITFKL